jgi:hypothetical protein
VPKHRGLGLSEPELALDLDVIEPSREREALELGSLRRRLAVGDQREAREAPAQSCQRLERAIGDAIRLLARARVELGGFLGERVVDVGSARERLAHDLEARAREVEAANSLALSVAPEPRADLEHRLLERIGGQALATLRHEFGHARLRATDTGAVVEDRVIEVEQ